MGTEIRRFSSPRSSDAASGGSCKGDDSSYTGVNRRIPKPLSRYSASKRTRNIKSPYQGTRSVGHGIRASRNSFLSFFPRPLLSLRASPFRPQAPFVDLESVSNQAKEILL